MSYTIRNLTRETTIAGSAEVARTFAQNLRGLMFRPSLSQGGGMVLYGTNWIHTFWMRFALDCIYIDRRQVVVGTDAGLEPNRIGKPYFRASAVIELPAGTIAASRTRVGDVLFLEPAGNT